MSPAALIQTSLWGWNSGFHLRWAVVAAVIAALYGVSDEYHQSLVVGRSSTIADVLTDAVGATFSAAGLWFTVKLLQVDLMCMKRKIFFFGMWPQDLL